MDKIKETISNLNTVVGSYIKDVIDKIASFFTAGYYLLYAVIGILLIILILAGLIGCFKKIPKLFIFLLIVLGAVGAIYWFLGR